MSQKSTNEPTTWNTECPIMTAKDRYLWSYFIVEWDDNKETTTYDKRIVGCYGDHGTVWNYGTAITGQSTNPTVFADSGIEHAVLGDAYVNIDTWDVYECVTGGDSETATWRYLNNIKGETGNNGISGIEYQDSEPETVIEGMTWIGN